MTQNLHYRVEVVNDFINTAGFVSYRRYGELQIWDASRTSSLHRGYQKSTDQIRVYLNHSLVGEFFETAQAEALIRRLVREAPVDIGMYLDRLIEENSAPSVGHRPDTFRGQKSVSWPGS